MNLLLEFTAAGGVLPFIQLLSTRIDRYVGNFLLFVLICEASFVIFTLVFTYREFKRLLKTDLKEYITAFWTWVEIALLGLSWTSIVLYFCCKRGHKLFFWWINSRDGVPTSATQHSLFLPKRESHVLQQRMVQYLEPRLGVRLNYITYVTYVFVS